jgi:hypothetical protein
MSRGAPLSVAYQNPNTDYQERHLRTTGDDYKVGLLWEPARDRIPAVDPKKCSLDTKIDKPPGQPSAAATQFNKRVVEYVGLWGLLLVGLILAENFWHSK